MKTRNADELLAKIRKGATAGFSTQDWLCCLDALGWSWVKVPYGREACYSIEAPNGQAFELKKEYGYRCIVFYDFEKWARVQGLIAAVEATIGAAPAKKTRQELEANTGTCPCCFGGFKLKVSADPTINPGMVFHGFKRPGWGYTIGECFGVNYAPYELSCEGTKAFLPLVQRQRDVYATLAEKLKTATTLHVERLSGKSFEMVSTDAGFENERSLQISNTNYRIKTIDRDIAFLQNKIDTWAPVALAK